ncbi:hypothetical protein IWQ60_001052 [Tieghemiomyces parasiticus]|uniref:JmjC domain-containing protein n=1 Tax=Tieghemiomyces parasiticus TaxID=78921 RepID=A0A9W8AEP7_9FUNG|nr:hypothetical protein IWQ60_001052 [Tieghemiomyces parasiticus]
MTDDVPPGLAPVDNQGGDRLPDIPTDGLHPIQQIIFRAAQGVINFDAELEKKFVLQLAGLGEPPTQASQSRANGIHHSDHEPVVHFDQSLGPNAVTPRLTPRTGRGQGTRKLRGEKATITTRATQRMQYEPNGTAGCRSQPYHGVLSSTIQPWTPSSAPTLLASKATENSTSMNALATLQGVRNEKTSSIRGRPPTVDPVTAYRENAVCWERHINLLSNLARECLRTSQWGFELIVPHTPVPVHPIPNNVDHFVQDRNCTPQAWRKLPQCRTCSNRKGDICRFQGIRVFGRGPSGNAQFGPFFQSMAPQPMVPYEAWSPVRRDPRLDTANHPNERYLMRVTADALRWIVNEELALCDGSAHPSYLRVTIGSRQSCDRCMTSIFNGFWLCSMHGCEYCHDCFRNWKEQHDADGPETSTDTSASRRFYECSKYAHSRIWYEHIPSQFVHIQRLASQDLTRVLQALDCHVPLHAEPEPLPALDLTRLDPGISVEHRDDSRPLVRGTYQALKLGDFQALWRAGKPLVVGGLLDQLRMDWSPARWSAAYGTELITVMDCIGNCELARNVPLKEFFAEFDSFETNAALPIDELPQDKASDNTIHTNDAPHADEPCTASQCARWLRSTNPRKILKIKDWPPQSDFKETFPDYFEDFMQALPFLEYTQRNGQLNLASRLPQSFIPPDLGPKMYIAYGSTDGAGGRGTTNLHLDMADAVNLMVHCSPAFQEQLRTRADPASPDYDPQFPPAAAVWDIYSFDDLATIRAFLLEVRPNTFINDPVHDQAIYLDATLRQQLYETRGVRGWRIYQNPGDAVFVPAGCAHQVCNYTNCIKVAMDFVSPENVSRCRQLTAEFRQLDRQHQRNADLLQLRSILYHAWTDAQAVIEGTLEDWRYGPRPRPPTPPPVMTKKRKVNAAKSPNPEAMAPMDEEGKLGQGPLVAEAETPIAMAVKTPTTAGSQRRGRASKLANVTPRSTPSRRSKAVAQAHIEASVTASLNSQGHPPPAKRGRPTRVKMAKPVRAKSADLAVDGSNPSAPQRSAGSSQRLRPGRPKSEVDIDYTSSSNDGEHSDNRSAATAAPADTPTRPYTRGAAIPIYSLLSLAASPSAANGQPPLSGSPAPAQEMAAAVHSVTSDWQTGPATLTGIFSEDRLNPLAVPPVPVIDTSDDTEELDLDLDDEPSF